MPIIFLSDIVSVSPIVTRLQIFTINDYNNVMILSLEVEIYHSPVNVEMNLIAVQVLFLFIIISMKPW